MQRQLAELPGKVWRVLADAAASFRRNNDLTAASSLAFSAMLALIPALFLLTVMLGTALDSSARAFQRTQELMKQVMPAYSRDILQEVRFIASHKGTIGLLNLVVLFWSITPLIADLRVSLGTIFRRKRGRPFLLEKLLDVAIGMLFLVGITGLSVAGIAFTFLEQLRPLQDLPGLPGIAPFFLLVTGVVLVLYYLFSTRIRLRHLLAGAFCTALLWFALRPAFHQFLTFNPGYGFAFGSFKSLFVVVIWIYISLVLFLYGAEVAAAIGRDATVQLKHLMEGRRNIPAPVRERHVTRFAKGSVIFRDGDPGSEMYSVLRGTVAIRKDEQEVGIIRPGRSFGGLSFLLSSKRTATAVALEDVELVTLDNENIINLMNEFPEFVVEMLREMALRLREANRLID